MLAPSAKRAARGVSRLVGAAMVSMLGVSLAATSHAQELAPEEGARVLFAKGSEAYAAGRYDDAIAMFESGDRLSPRAAFAYNLAVAYEGKGDAARALEHYRDYRRRGPKPEEAAMIQADIERLESVLRARGVQQVTIYASPGAAIMVDGAWVGASPWTGELAPGEHAVVVRSSGGEPVSTSVETPADRAVDINIDTTFTPALRSYQRPLGWTLLGVTGVSATAGTVLGALALDRMNSLDEVCGTTSDRCPKGSEDAIDGFRTMRTLSYVSFGVAAASAVGTVVLFALPDGSEPAIEVSLHPYDPLFEGAHVTFRQNF